MEFKALADGAEVHEHLWRQRRFAGRSQAGTVGNGFELEAGPGSLDRGGHLGQEEGLAVAGRAQRLTLRAEAPPGAIGRPEIEYVNLGMRANVGENVPDEVFRAPGLEVQKTACEPVARF